MAYGVLYEFRRTSTNGADILITISQRDYEGEVKKRSLGRAPVIKRENNGHIYGTSCELYAECLVDGEFSQLYTSDAYEFRVAVYRNDSLLWMGFVSPELYSEPDVAPPYDVQIIATDGLGELKNFKFEKRGVASMLSHINYLKGKTGIGMALNIVSELRYVDDAGVASADKGVLDFKINLDHEEGSTCYDVLQNLLSSINANITQYNGRYLIFRETDFINKATEEGVEGFDINGSAVSLPIATFGSMNQHKWWPVGQLSTVIEPAKNEVVLRAPNHYKDNVMDFDNWALANAASFNEEEGAYILPDEGSYISYELDFDGNEVYYRLGLRVRARNVGSGPYGGTSDEDQNIGLIVEIDGGASAENLGNQFWLIKSEGISSGHPLSEYMWKNTEDYFEEELRVPSAADSSADAQNIDIILPLYDTGINNYGSYAYAKNIKITIFNPAGIHDIYVYDVSLVKYEQIEGYEAEVVINNAAREEEGDIELTMSAGDRAPSAGKVFMSGLPLLPSGSDPIKQWQVGDSNQQDYLSVMAYDYSRAIALPKMKYAGVLNVPGSSVSVPLLFLRDGTYYFPKTYSFNIYDDELEIELISISAADVSLSSVIISQMAQISGNMGGLTTSGSGGGGVVSLPRDKEMSDTSDNAVENRVIKAYVDSVVKEVADLLNSMWRIEDDKIVTDMDVLVKANLIVEKDTSSGGEGQDTPASGTVTGIKVSASQTLTPNTAGVIDMVDTLASIDVSDQLKDYALKTDIPSLDGYATETWVNDQGYLTGITQSMIGTALGSVNNGGKVLISTGGGLGWASLPTSLPASDVYAWAKKPSLALADVPDLSSKYLLLTGGTVGGDTNIVGLTRLSRYATFPLQVETTDPSAPGVGIRFRQNGTNTIGLYTDFTTDMLYRYSRDLASLYTILDSGNYSSYALPLSGGKMTGTITVGDFTAFGQTGGNFYLGTPAYPLLLRSNGTTTINGNTLIHSGNIGNQLVKGLEKSVTIWGKSFDGTANIENQHLLIYKNPSGSTGSWARGVRAMSSKDSTLATFAFHGSGDALTKVYIGNSYISPWMSILPSGYVGIGTTDPQYKLDVAGTGRFTGAVTMSNELFLDNNMGIYFKNTSGTNVLAMYVNPSNVLQVGYNNVDSVAFQKPVTMSSTLRVGGNCYLSGMSMIYQSDNLYRLTSYTSENYARIYNIKEDGSSYGSMYIGQNSTGAIVIKDGSYVGVGATPSGNYKLEVNGNIFTNSTLIATAIFGGPSSSLKWRLINDASSNGLWLQAALADLSSNKGKMYLSGINGVNLTELNLYADNTKASKVTLSASLTTPVISATGGLDIVANNSAAGSRLYLTTNVFRPWGDDAGLIDLGASSVRWRSVYSVGGNFSGAVSIGNTLTVTAGGAKVTGDTTINGNLVVSGDVATDGSGSGSSTTESNCLGPVELEMQSISNTGTFTKAQMDSLGLTSAVISNMLAGLYTKVVDQSGGDVYDYTGFGTLTNCKIFLRQGNGVSIDYSYTLVFNGTTWTVTEN